MLNNSPDIMTVKDLMKALQIGKNKALQLLNEGQITGLRQSLEDFKRRCSGVCTPFINSRTPRRS